MRLRRAVPKIPPKSSVSPGLPLYKRSPLLTDSKSTLLRVLIPRHFNFPRINTYKKPGGGCPSPGPWTFAIRYPRLPRAPWARGAMLSPRAPWQAGTRLSFRPKGGICFFLLPSPQLAPHFSQESSSVSFHEAYSSFVFILLRPLLHFAKRYRQSFQRLPHSFRKTPRVGVYVPRPAQDRIWVATLTPAWPVTSRESPVAKYLNAGSSRAYRRSAVALIYSLPTTRPSPHTNPGLTPVFTSLLPYFLSSDFYLTQTNPAARA
jgi:hypothetical protein